MRGYKVFYFSQKKPSELLGGINALAKFKYTPASCHQNGVEKITKLLGFLSQCLIILINKSQFSLIYYKIVCKEHPQKYEKR